MRYNNNGCRDATFPMDGIVMTPVGVASNMPFALVIQPDGKLVVAGRGHNGANEGFAVVRWLP